MRVTEERLFEIEERAARQRRHRRRAEMARKLKAYQLNFTWMSGSLQDEVIQCLRNENSSLHRDCISIRYDTIRSALEDLFPRILAEVGEISIIMDFNVTEKPAAIMSTSSVFNALLKDPLFISTEGFVVVSLQRSSGAIFDYNGGELDSVDVDLLGDLAA